VTACINKGDNHQVPIVSRQSFAANIVNERNLNFVCPQRKPSA